MGIPPDQHPLSLLARPPNREADCIVRALTATCLCAILSAPAALARVDVPQGFRHRVLTEHVRWTPKAYARHLLHRRGQDAQWPCLNALWERESGWRPLAHNPSSGAHGIPQSLPGSKMARYGADWWSNPRTQIRWGLLGYVFPRYGTPCGAWAHSQATGWY